MNLNLLEFVKIKQFSGATDMSQGEGYLFVQSFLVFLISNSSTAFHHITLPSQQPYYCSAPLCLFFQNKIPNASETRVLIIGTPEIS